MANHKVTNSESGITIGYCYIKNQPHLYTQKGLERKIVARFTNTQTARQFFDTLEEYDNCGGNDGELI